jgi:hypothetical protein
VIKKARRRGAVSGLRCLIQTKMLEYFLDHTGIFDSGNDLSGGVPPCRHIYRTSYRTSQFLLKRRALTVAPPNEQRVIE